MSRSWVRVACALAVTTVLVGGCGADSGVGTGSGSFAFPYAQAVGQPYPIAAVMRTPDPRGVRVTVQGVPATTATGVCHADVTFEVAEAPLTVGIAVTVTSRLLAPFTGCSTQTRQLLIRLKAPLGRRDVFASDRVTPQGGRFIAVGPGYVECHPPSCNPMYQPVVPDCAQQRDAIAGTDMPAHFGMDGPCHLPFAAIVVDIGAGACPVTGGVNSCAGKRLTRQFWYSDGKFWRLLLQGDRATCADARRAFPTFQLGLCSDPTWRRAVSRQH